MFSSHSMMFYEFKKNSKFSIIIAIVDKRGENGEVKLFIVVVL